MFYWMLTFFILSIISGILSFAGFSDMTIRHIGKMTFGTFVILFLILFILYILNKQQNGKK